MDNFESLIRDNAEAYYKTGKQNLSDDDFDALVANVEQTNPNSNVLNTGWGFEVKGNKVKHKYGHIGSLKKVHTVAEVRDKLNLKSIDISAKLDGLSCVIYIENGVIIKALTRGDGEYGLDITDKIHTIVGETISDRTFTGAVRGELIMSRYNFSNYCKEHNIDPLLANQRNITAGIINKEDIDKDLMYVNFYVYSLVGYEKSDELLKEDLRFSDIVVWFKNNFMFYAPRFTTNDLPKYMPKYNDSNIEELFKELKDSFSSQIFIDGLVLSDNDLLLENNVVSQNSYAYKFDDYTIATEVLGVEWTLSKNSAYIPVVLIKPIILDGTVVKRVTGFNAKFILENKIKKGTIVKVCKRNQIIPQIVGVIENV